MPAQKVKKPAKRPPSKPTHSPFGVKSRSRTTTITGAEKGEVKGLAWLRFAAGTEYVTNLEGLSIRAMNTRPPFDQVTRVTLGRWCIEDDWVGRRQTFFEAITAEAKEHVRGELVRTRVDQLFKMEAIAVQMADKILSGIVEAKSEEGMVTALVKLLESSEGLREKIAAQIVPTHLGGMQQESLPMIPKLSNEETRAAVTAVLQQRRLQTRQRIKADAQAKNKAEAEGNPAKKPRLRVVRDSEDG